VEDGGVREHDVDRPALAGGPLEEAFEVELVADVDALAPRGPGGRSRSVVPNMMNSSPRTATVMATTA